MSVQKIDYPNNGGPDPDGDADRIETGAVQFGNDWPGLFVRGDNAAQLSSDLLTVLDWVLDNDPPPAIVFQIARLEEAARTIQEDVLVG